MGSTSASGATIRFVDVGSREPALLLMPGWCSDRVVFDPIISTLAGSNRVIALDWRGHGESEHPEGDFDNYELVEDALAVIEASGAESVIPVGLSHAGWVAIALRRRLGARVPGLVLLEWIVTEPPAAFSHVLQGLQSAQWKDFRGRLFEIWRGDVRDERLESFLRDVMGKYDGAMWARAGRSIRDAYEECGSPLQELARLDPPAPVLHIYSQPADDGYAELQAAYAATHPWYSFHKLSAKSHFPMFEKPDELARVISDFVNKNAKRKAA